MQEQEKGGKRAPRRVGGSPAPHDIYNRILFARATASPDRITEKDLEKGKRALSELSEMKPFMKECARRASLEKDAETRGSELKKIAYGLALIDFVEALNKRAEKSSDATSGDYQVFCSAASLCAGAFREDFFSLGLEKSTYVIYMVESAIEACAEIYGMGPLLFEETSAKYMKRAEEFAREAEKEEKTFRGKIRERASWIMEMLENGKDELRKEAKEKILELLEMPENAGVKYRLLTREYDGASMDEPSEEFVLFGKGDKKEIREAKLARVAEHYIEELESELEFLREMEKKLDSGAQPAPEERKLLEEMVSGKRRERAAGIKKP